MKTYSCSTFIKLILIPVTVALCQLDAAETEPSFESIGRKSKLEFVAATTAFIKVSGSAPLPDVAVQLKSIDGKRILEISKITLPVKELKTGLAVRDDHMYEKVFATGDALSPITVEAAQVPLPSSSGTKGVRHPLEVSFRGKSNPCVFTIEWVEKNGQLISGKATAKVSLQAHGVPEISYLGVAVKDEVELVVSLVFEKSKAGNAAIQAAP